MSKKNHLYNFIQYGIFTDEAISTFMDDNIINNKQMLRDTFHLLHDAVNDMINDEYHINFIKNGIDLFYILCDKIDFNKEEIEINRNRIKKLREPILSFLKIYDNEFMLNCANKLDDIVLDKNVDANALVQLVKRLIDNSEDIDIIKKFLKINREAVNKKENELFDYVFFKAIKSIETEDRDIYYYISLLKILFSSKIDKSKYLKILNNCCSKNNIFCYEIYLIINGVKRGLSLDEIIEKYGVIEDLPDGPLIKTSRKHNNDVVISIDGTSTYLRDDGLSIKKDGNNYIVGIHVADVAGSIARYSELDMNAKNNFECMYMSGRVTRMLPSNIEKNLSLDFSKKRGVISLYVILNDSGELIDYYIEKNDIIVSKNLSYLESEQILNNLSCTELSKQINELFFISNAIASRNENKERYWEKKEKSKKYDKLRDYKSDVIVREFMSLYNLLISKIAREKSIPFVYRIQDEEYISQIVADMNMYVDDYTRKIIENIYLESKYSAIPRKHSGLGYSQYSHSSDPLRRYPDLYNQFLLHRFYFNDIDFDFDELQHLDMVNYCNQRSVELSLMKGEYNREARLIKRK